MDKIENTFSSGVTISWGNEINQILTPGQDALDIDFSIPKIIKVSKTNDIDWPKCTNGNAEQYCIEVNCLNTFNLYADLVNLQAQRCRNNADEPCSKFDVENNYCNLDSKELQEPQPNLRCDVIKNSTGKWIIIPKQGQDNALCLKMTTKNEIGQPILYKNKLYKNCRMDNFWMRLMHQGFGLINIGAGMLTFLRSEDILLKMAGAMTLLIGVTLSIIYLKEESCTIDPGATVTIGEPMPN